jgi:hypothetical protein
LRVKCPCGSHLFLVHTPPPKTEPSQRKVYLICEGCRKIWKLQDAQLPDVDENGVLKTKNEVFEKNKDALVRGAVQVLNGTSREVSMNEQPTKSSSLAIAERLLMACLWKRRQ